MRANIFVIALAAAALSPSPALATGKLQLYGLRMDPSDRDSRDFSRPGWGGGVDVVAPLPGTADLVAFVGGIEAVNLLSRTVKFSDPTTGLRIEQQTSQNYSRFLAGGQFGSHSGGFLRPYLGANLALVLYEIHTDVVVPDDRNRENEIRQSLRERIEAAFGWDANAGLDLNFNDRWNLDAGVRWLHSYGVPEQLGVDAVRIEPSYVQYRIGFGVSFRTLQGMH